MSEGAERAVLKFKKPTNRSKNIRIISKDTNDDNKEELSIRKAVNSVENNVNQQIVASKLSFTNDDGDVSNFKLKKSKKSRQLVLQFKEKTKNRENYKDNSVCIDNSTEDSNLNLFEIETTIKDENVEFLTTKSVSTTIPDSSVIFSARKKRENARRMLNQDYISLDDTVSMAEKSENFPKDIIKNSRLIREGDSSDDCDLVGEMVGIKSNDTIKDEIYMEDNSKLSSNDEDYEKWENEQLLKGSHVLGKLIVDSYNENVDKATWINNSLNSNRYGPEHLSSNLMFSATEPPEHLNKPLDMSILTLTSVIDDLQLNLTKNISQNNTINNQLVDYSKTINDTEEAIKLCEEEISLENDHYIFYEELYSYVENLIDFIDQMTENLDSLVQRQYIMIEEHVIKRLDQLKQHISLKNSVATSKLNIIELTDDNIQLCNDINRISSDIRNEVENLFSDVKEEYINIELILARFDHWRSRYPSTYKSAFVPLYLSKLIAFHMKINFLNFNFFMNDLNDDIFSHKNALHQLLNYSSKYFDVNMCIPTSPNNDIYLIPLMYNFVLIPKMIVYVKLWNPFNTKESANLAQIIKYICYDNPITDEFASVDFHNDSTFNLIPQLFDQVTKQMIDSIDCIFSDLNLVISKQPQALSSLSDNFIVNNLFIAHKVITSLCYFNGIIHTKKLQEICLNHLFMGKIAPLFNYNIISIPLQYITQLIAIIMTFPVSWFDPSLICSPITLNIAMFIQQLAQKILSITDTILDTNAISNISSLISTLKHLNFLKIAELLQKNLENKLPNN